MTQLKTIHATSGETLKVTNQWAAQCEKRGTTVTSSAWTYSGSGTVASKTLATPVASCVLSPASNGTLTNTATLANGEVLIATRLVQLN